MQQHALLNVSIRCLRLLVKIDVEVVLVNLAMVNFTRCRYPNNRKWYRSMRFF
jgi:hypothetical protein